MMIKVGIIGCGNHANTHAQVVQASSFATFTACADANLDRAASFAGQYGIQGGHYSSLQAMLSGQQIDLLIIAAFPTAHPELVKEAISCGVKYIVCEKPLALKVEQAVEIAALSERNHALVVEGLMYRSHPQIRKAMELVQSEIIGDIRYIQAQFTDCANNNPGNWRNNRSLGGGSMTAKGCYMVDACNLFAGSTPKAAFCIETTDPQFDVEVGETGTILYENGVTAQFETNHRSVWREEMKICGTMGTILIPHAIVTKEQRRHIILERNGHYEAKLMEVEKFEFSVSNSYALQLENMYRCMTEDAQPNFPIEASILNYRVTDALMKSVQTGKLEPIHWGS